MKQISKGAKWILAFSWLVSSQAFSDQYHYNNVLLGERASGLGGAFCAVADDASAVVYNPAGLGFALANDISGSANAFYQKEVTYKQTIDKKDFVERSKGTLSPFVGALGKLDHIMPGLVFAFGIYSTDSELKDQDDYVVGSNVIFHRTANMRANTSKIGVALGKRFGSKFSIGFGLNWINADELVQEYQDVTSGALVNDVDGNGDPVLDEDGAQTQTLYARTLTQNVRQLLEITGLEPVLGAQLAIGGSLSFGLTIKKAFLITNRFEQSRETTVTYRNTKTDKVTDGNDTGIQNPSTYRSIRLNDNQKDPMEWPMEVRLGMAWFASTNTLVASDIIYYSEAKGDNSIYHRESIMNYALGVEHYFTPSWPVRLGFFTNNDARPEIKSDKMDQGDHIDYMGASLFVAMAQPNSQIAVGVIHQIGKGKAQKISGTTTTQDVQAKASTVGFTVSHSF